jgi:pilus assembly protein FimV
MGMGRETQGRPTGEQKLERYGVWVKVEPRTVVESQGSESSLELTDLEASGAAASLSRDSSLESTLTLEEEKLLDELDTELGPSEPGKELSIPEEEPLLAGDEELPDISEVAEKRVSTPSALEPVSEDELPELEIEEEPATVPAGHARRGATPAESNEIEVTLSETRAGHERFEDLDALESELASVTAPAGKPPAGSSEILARIEDELRSIRADLTQLRGELSGMRKSGGQTAAVTESPAGAEAQSGFFDEDEDETIALTGDELDNILNTAEITEESAEAAPVGELDDVTEMTQEALPVDRPEIMGPETLELPESAEAGTEELPSELELEDLSSESTPAAGPVSVEGLPELDLEGIPEIETPEKSADTIEEVGDLETLDLEEEASEVENVSQASGDLELSEEKPEEQIGGPIEHPDELTGDVDLEALAAEAEELESDEAAAPSQDVEIGELEAVADESASPAGEPREIEIAFESEPEKTEDRKAEKPAAKGTAKPASREGAAAIPDNLKDEIRTVLQYMDHLLEALPDEKIQEFAKSDYFVMYKKLFEDLGLGE